MIGPGHNEIINASLVYSVLMKSSLVIPVMVGVFKIVHFFNSNRKRKAFPDSRNDANLYIHIFCTYIIYLYVSITFKCNVNETAVLDLKVPFTFNVIMK